MIATDGVHLMATTLVELHAFARRLGLRRAWFQDHPRHPHYDLMTREALRRALTVGVVLGSSRELLTWMDENGPNQTPEAVVS